MWLWLAALPVWAVECAQITNWSQADFNAAVYPTVIAVNGPSTVSWDQSTAGRATYIVAVPQPAGARTLSNNTSITIYSFASAADAAAYYAWRGARTGLPSVYEQPGQVSITTTSLNQGSVSDLYLDALYRSTVILVAGYADASQPMASSSAVSLYLNFLSQAKALVDTKCGVESQPNRPPTISLAPDPEAAPAFQELMTRGHEFEISIDDPDGFGDLDLGTFKVWVAGVDKSRHFLEIVAAHPSRVRYIESATGRTFYLRPDPRFLMTDFNYFNIQWNGRWPVSFGICDRQGACARADYTIYFGPYFTPTESTFLGQVGGACVGGDGSIRVSYIVGNNGYGSRDVVLYAGLQRPGDGAYWTYGRGETAFWHYLALVPAGNWPDAGSGAWLTTALDAVLTLDTKPADLVIPAGTYQFIMAAAEPDATDLLLVSRTAVICPH